MKDLVGEWISRYEYGSGVGEHRIKFIIREDCLVGSGTGEDGSRLRLDLTYEDGILTGTWSERTSKKGEYGGQIFYGALQMILNDQRDKADGTWVGFNRRRSKVNHGPWFVRKA